MRLPSVSAPSFNFNLKQFINKDSNKSSNISSIQNDFKGNLSNTLNIMSDTNKAKISFCGGDDKYYYEMHFDELIKWQLPWMKNSSNNNEIHKILTERYDGIQNIVAGKFAISTPIAYYIAKYKLNDFMEIANKLTNEQLVDVLESNETDDKLKENTSVTITRESVASLLIEKKDRLDKFIQLTDRLNGDQFFRIMAIPKRELGFRSSIWSYPVAYYLASETDCFQSLIEKHCLTGEQICRCLALRPITYNNRTGFEETKHAPVAYYYALKHPDEFKETMSLLDNKQKSSILNLYCYTKDETEYTVGDTLKLRHPDCYEAIVKDIPEDILQADETDEDYENISPGIEEFWDNIKAGYLTEAQKKLSIMATDKFGIPTIHKLAERQLPEEFLARMQEHFSPKTQVELFKLPDGEGRRVFDIFAERLSENSD